MDAARTSLIPTALDNRQARDVRRSELDARVDRASVSLLERLDPEAIAKEQSAYNEILGGLDGLKGEGGLRIPDQDWLKKLRFPGASAQVREATQPNPADNKKAQSLKQRYQSLHNEARMERSRAERLYKVLGKHGDGPHQLSNGDTVTFKRGENGDVTVTVTNKSGETKTTQYNECDPDKVKVTRKQGGIAGHVAGETTLEMDGTKVTQTHDSPFGGRSQESYSLDKQGRPVQDLKKWPPGGGGLLGGFSPFPSEHTRTTANDDGSTDTRTQVYIGPEGPVYFDHHEDPNPIIRPWQPINPKPWDLDGWRPNPLKLEAEPEIHPDVLSRRAAAEGAE